MAVGVHVFPRPGESAESATWRIRQVTGRPVLARRHDYGDVIPESAAGSPVQQDIITGRKMLMAFTPPGCTPAQLAAFLSSCRDAGLSGDVEIWPGIPHGVQPVRYKVACEIYAPVIRAAGFTHSFTTSNYAVVALNALRFWPGDDLVDQVMVTMFPTGLTMDTAARFADDHGKPFGIAELWAPASHDRPSNVRYLRHVHEFLMARLDRGLPVADVIWLDGDRDGDLSDIAPYAREYQQMHDELA